MLQFILKCQQKILTGNECDSCKFRCVQWILTHKITQTLTYLHYLPELNYFIFVVVVLGVGSSYILTNNQLAIDFCS